MGPHWAKDGGRIGYQGGELVEQETDFIQGPQGGEEFQETVVEGQEQPSREQLEALAMEIFQLPLEELDEQQLLVVYQEAMQGQPMEEAVQEEDVQYAAQRWLSRSAVMAKIVQSLTRASPEYEESTFQSLVRDLDGVITKLNTSFQDEVKQEIEAKSFFLE